MSVEASREKYNELFPDEKSKAEAFDKLAEQYYFMRFGSMSKSDMDVLMFSIYLDRILESSGDNYQTYSDYTLSKNLGITQTRIGILKEKKELQYPYEKFNWRNSFYRILNNYRVDNGKVKLYIPDRNLFLEIKNAIESNGQYIDIQLNSKLLQVDVDIFVDFIIFISNEEDQKKIREKIKKDLRKHRVNTEEFEKKTIGESLKEVSVDIASDIIYSSLEQIPIVGKTLGKIVTNVLESKK